MTGGINEDRRAGTGDRGAPHMLRYYEKRGLLDLSRDPNGYRSCGAHQVERVKKICGLLDSGIPLRIVAQIPPLRGRRDRG